MAYKYFYLLLFLQVTSVLSLNKKIDFHIGALIPYNTMYGFRQAIELAVETIHNKSVLQGHRLVIHYKYTILRPFLAIDSLIELRARNPSEAIKICVIGPAVSKVAYYTARLSTVWGPLQLSYGASTPELLDGSTYPRFLTVVPTSVSLNKALIKMLKFVNWKRLGLIYDINSKDFFLPTMSDLQVRLISENFDIVMNEGISITGDGKAQVIKRMKENDIRIVIALLYQVDLPKVFCEAFNQGFYGRKIVWVIYMADITRFSKYCNTSKLLQVIKGMFILDFLYLRTDQKRTMSGLTAQQYNTEIKKTQKRRTDKHSLAFDTTWLLALAINASLPEAIKLQMSPEKRMNTGALQKIKEKIMKIGFEGITGNVKFNGTERLGTAIIRQVGNGYNVKDIAQHITRTNVFTFFDNSTSAAFLSESYVRDGPAHVYEVYHYSPILCTIIWIISSIGIIIALSLVYFNYKNREIRYIKMSSPYLNNIIIFGGLLSYVKVILDTLDARFLKIETYGSICNVRVWLMSLGFTSAFGAMFSKTWRVHKIFTASQKFKRAVIKNVQLYGLLVGLLVFDITQLFLWTLFSPYKYDMFRLPEKAKPDEDKILHPSVYRCISEHDNIFLITSFCYKGLLLIFGIFLAWETRHIEIKALNDSKYIGMSVYNVVVLSVVGVVIATLLSETNRYNLYLALMSSVVILVTTTTLAIVFVPKILGLQNLLNSKINKSLTERSYTSCSLTDSTSQAQCCCCEDCKCRCRRRQSSIHVNNQFLASHSTNRRNSSSVRKPNLPSVTEIKPNSTECSY